MPAVPSIPTSSRRSLERPGPLLWLAAASCLVYAAMLAAGDLKARLPLYIILHAALFALYLAAVRVVLKAPSRAGRTPLVVFSAAVLFRLLLLAAPPALSDDIWRYLWEGRLHWEGVNPYAYPPDAPELEPLRDEVHARVNHRHLPAIYPPVTQWAMALGALGGPSPLAMKSVFIAADLGLILALARLLRGRGLPVERALIYAWNPLAVVEVAGSGHNDTLALAFLVAAAAAMAAKRRLASAAALALAGLSKLSPWALVPLFARPARAALAVLPLLAAAAYLPYLDAGARLFHSTVVYAESWRSNASLFGLLVEGARASGVSGPLTGWMSARGLNNLYGQPHMLARLVAALALAGFMVLLLRRQARGAMPLERGIFLFTGAALMLTPTLHPWYLLWVLPWMALRVSPAWLALSALAPLAYTGAWWAPWAQYLPFYGLLAASAAARRGRGGAVIE